MQPALPALLICVAAAGLEGALAGSGVRQRLAQLRMPPYSPPFPLWLVIGFLYYAICFVVLRHLLALPSSTLRWCALSSGFHHPAGERILERPLFRWKDLRASFVMFVPYALVVAALIAMLLTLYPFGAALFLCYGLYLLYATWWAYQLCRLNSSKG